MKTITTEIRVMRSNACLTTEGATVIRLADLGGGAFVTLEQPDAGGDLAEGVLAIDATPVRRMGRPEDIAATCSFLISEEAGYITGQIVGVNGGRNT